MLHGTCRAVVLSFTSLVTSAPIMTAETGAGRIIGNRRKWRETCNFKIKFENKALIFMLVSTLVFSCLVCDNTQLIEITFSLVVNSV